MNILILSNVGSGLYLFRKELLAKLILEGHEVTVAFPRDEYSEKFIAVGCTYVDIQMSRRGMNPIADLKLLWSYMNLMKKREPDVVLTYTIKPNVYGGLACQLTKIPYLANVTGLGTSITNSGLLQKVSLLLYRIGLKGAQCVFYQNKDNKSFMGDHGISGKRTCLLPGSGVNLDSNPYREYPSTDDVISFLTVGRIMKDKGIDELLTCAKDIHTRYPNTKFSLAGMYDDIAYTAKIEEAVTEGYLEYLGIRSDIPELMAKSHCIIHPSYHEGLSNVLLEAAACGRPVIASNVPGCRETFDEGLSGFGVDAKSAESLIHAVERFLTLSQEERVAMGLHGRKKVEQEFDRNLVISAYLEELELLNREK